MQSDVSIAQKHQDLYVSPNDKTPKAEQTLKSSVNNQIITEAKFKHNQTDIRNQQLGLVPADSGDVIQKQSSGSNSRFRFGEAPRADHLNTGSMTSQQANTSIKQQSNNTGEEYCPHIYLNW